MVKKTKALQEKSTIRLTYFDGSNYTYWKTKMRIFLTSCDFDLWQVILDGHLDLTSERHTWDEKAKKAHVLNAKALMLYFVL